MKFSAGHTYFYLQRAEKAPSQTLDELLYLLYSLVVPESGEGQTKKRVAIIEVQVLEDL